jgi:hypothetical protein
MIYKTLHRKLKIEQHELTKNRGVNSCVPKGLIDFDFWCLNANFSYIMATSFSGVRSRSARREPPTMGKQLVSFITCESSAPFFVIYKAGPESTPYW